MIDLAALAGELDALARDGRRIRLGDRNIEKPFMELDELLARIEALAGRVRAGSLPHVGGPRGAHMPDGYSLLDAAVITGRGQVLVCRTRGPQR